MNLKTLLITLLIPFSIQAQHAPRCLQEPLTEPNHIEAQAALEVLTQNWIEQQSEANIRTVLTIPVVVHVVYHDSIENIPDQQIYDQIAVLNEDFRQRSIELDQIPGEFQAVAADVELEFCLVNIDSNENPTNGITRTYTNYTCIGNTLETLGDNNRPRLFYTDEGGQDVWDTDKYLNIYVANTCEAFLGRARLPGTAIAAEDAAVIDYDHFGSNCGPTARPFDLGKTTTHEIGHYFNLKHVFGVVNSCSATNGDSVTDTPNQESAYLGCPNYPQFSCNSSDMFMNYMDFVDDACMQLFTTGQKNRMLATLLDPAGPRRGLLEGNRCADPVPAPAKDQLVVAPNPPQDCLYFELESAYSGKVNVRLFDALGHLFYEQENNAFALKRIETSHLVSGVYFLVVTYEDEVLSEKVFLNN